jgi:hypothetical protein
MGERFVFISSIGFAIFTGRLIYNYLPKLTPPKKSSSSLTGIIVVIILGFFSLKTR